MATTKNPYDKKELKKALNTIKFWYKILLETEYMNDLDNRLEYQSAINIIKEHKKKMKGS
ncbi:hypothetical protein GFJ99_11610 [Flavobacterium sp. LMO6]|uniref:Uncharacterized protein n=1 Tax=Flavobacterium phage vB_FspS_laban6-1 TaxID=2686250 RepID=A0A6B9LM37_9CAUD|nr:hypothetical protein [Flavobacterium sp. LMO6]YP_009854811.1 hypothetical protein HWC90_gp13 [Flavobacterium phage vB_FspS_laban6-1]MQP63341.1 hypothetical protein [Flavobacterium sp. LMO6]QHB38984.1 hypothetical protein laban61_gp013 [Flavobacterium phage vB_FspS_laban6-1]